MSELAARLVRLKALRPLLLSAASVVISLVALGLSLWAWMKTP